VPPPQIDTKSEYHPSHDPKYKQIDPAELPTGESLKITCERVLPYFKDQIVPFIRANNNVIISAHGNSLRAILKELFDVADKDIPVQVAGAQAKGASVYVALEPCSHYGQTAPCANALIEAGIAQCVIAVIDPDPRRRLRRPGL